MSDKAVITTLKNDIGVYLHNFGSLEWVSAYLTYCRAHKFRSPEYDNYGWARLCQVIANHLDPDGLDIGIDVCDNLDMHNEDNGVYVIQDWKIVSGAPWEAPLEPPTILQYQVDSAILMWNMIEINARQPVEMRLTQSCLERAVEEYKKRYKEGVT